MERIELIGQLKDEIAVLKGEKKRPRFKASGMEEKAGQEEKESEAGDKKRAGSEKRSKTQLLEIHEERVIAPEGNRSHRGQQRGCGLSMEVSMDSLDEPGEDVALLTAAGFDHGQEALDETTAGRRLCAERELAPDHGVPQCLLGAVVGRLHAFDLDEGPQTFAMFPQFLAEAVDALVVVAAQQVLFHLPADRFHPLTKGAAGDRPIAHFLPEGEHFPGRPHQVVAEAFADGTGAIDQSLEVAFQMSPAPLQAAEGPVHPRPVAVDDAGKIAAEQLPGHLGGPAGAAREKGEGVGDEGADPTLVRAFLGRRFIDEQHGLGGSCWPSSS